MKRFKAIPWNRTYDALKVTKSTTIQEIKEFDKEFNKDTLLNLQQNGKINEGDIVIKNEHGDIAIIDQITFDMLFKSVM